MKWLLLVVPSAAGVALLIAGTVKAMKAAENPNAEERRKEQEVFAGLLWGVLAPLLINLIIIAVLFWKLQKMQNQNKKD